MSDLTGRRLGEYELGRKLGSGKFGEVKCELSTPCAPRRAPGRTIGTLNYLYCSGC